MVRYGATTVRTKTTVIGEVVIFSVAGPTPLDVRGNGDGRRWAPGGGLADKRESNAGSHTLTVEFKKLLAFTHEIADVFDGLLEYCSLMRKQKKYLL